MNSSSDVLVNYLGYDERDVEFERVISNIRDVDIEYGIDVIFCLLYTSPSPRDLSTSRMPSSA